MSKSRYEPLVKLKKKALDTAERALIGANNALSSASDKLNRAYEELSHMSLPTHGSVGEFTQATSMIHTQHQTIEQAQQTLRLAEERQRQVRERFKAAMIDYEKFKYLEVQEMNARLKHLKTQEAKMLDEIGTMTYRKEAL
ncbi:MAG: flagellar FliJ family protein [Sulfuricurvum sp.]|uniref:flagellar export protein FliJ n=1 Tax=Sulfuricurvum sp. TaxID=2025608 RepID=UPI0025D9D765|nr:flagellar export protein FliJ [Sulfuricurvum sp.]MBV5320130.1 flagellar FliJ family protein [Sulfuricurvum sp.]